LNFGRQEYLPVGRVLIECRCIARAEQFEEVPIMDLTAGKPLVALMLALLAASTATAQLGDAIPHSSYYAAVQALYSGDYRSASREFGGETRRAIHTPQSRWIDSICYYAMAGEVLYHQGRTADALAQFDQACEAFLAYPNWLLQVRFQQNLRPDAIRARRTVTWGHSDRTFVIGQFPATEQVLVGDLDASKTLQNGGVFRTPMLWRVNVIEVMRTTALAIRRRNEILGPLAAQDPISRQLSAALSAGNLAPPNHWSIAWIDLLRGLAQEGAGKLDEADMLLGRSLVIDAQFDHPLTGVGLLEQGRIAALRGDTRRATRLFAEAGYSAFYFEDWDVLTESALNGWLNHLATGSPGVYPPLEPIATWAQASRFQHVTTKLRLAQAESLLWLGQLAAGASIVDDVGKRIGDMRIGLPGIHLLYLQAAVQILQGRIEPGGEALTRALIAQAGASLRNFQIDRTNAMYDSRAASARVAVDLYVALLADPSPADWLRNPLDAMAVVGTGQDAAFDRWLLAALERKDAPLALSIAERAKRHRYLAMQPFGARLLALRAILESPETDLSPDGLAQRQQIFSAFPQYRTLIAAARKTETQLRAGSVLANNANDTKPLTALYDQWDRNAAQRQSLLAQIAVRRLPSSLEFPPLRSVPELQNSLSSGESLVVFHTVGENLYAFLVTTGSVNLWQLPDPRKMRAGIGSLLHSLGNYGPNRDLSVAELKSAAWHKNAKDAYTAIFGEKRLDLSKTTGLVIVPDNAVWYLPFEVLISANEKTEKVLADRFPIRYGPTASLAVSRLQPLRRVQHTAIVASDLKFAGDESDRTKVLHDLSSAVTGPLLLPQPMLQPSRLVSPLLDNLVVLDEVAGDTIGDASSLLPRSRSAAKDKSSSAVALPYGGPERMTVTGYKTQSEQGAKSSRRGQNRARTGDEVFQSLCNMMSSGARTVLLSRWRTAGRTNFDLVREFAKESADAPAAEAWQRACLLARENPIDPNHEPRLKHSDETGDPPKADHPFFWAGYLLVDTGPRPEKVEAPNNNVVNGKALPQPAKPAEPANNLPPPLPPKGAADKGPDKAVDDGVARPKNDEPKVEQPKPK
jgi:hypothetical protein